LSPTESRSISSPVSATGSLSPRLREVIRSALCVISSTGLSARLISKYPPAIAIETTTGRPMAMANSRP
jgi:hypothetical protein